MSMYNGMMPSRGVDESDGFNNMLHQYQPRVQAQGSALFQEPMMYHNNSQMLQQFQQQQLQQLQQLQRLLQSLQQQQQQQQMFNNVVGGAGDVDLNSSVPVMQQPQGIRMLRQQAQPSGDLQMPLVSQQDQMTAQPATYSAAQSKSNPKSSNPDSSLSNSDDGSKDPAGKGLHRRAIHFTLEEVSKYFHLPISQAALELGVCTTVVKKVCRRHGINRWPQRKLSSLGKCIRNLQEASHGVVKVNSTVQSITKLIEPVPYQPQARDFLKSPVQLKIEVSDSLGSWHAGPSYNDVYDLLPVNESTFA